MTHPTILFEKYEETNPKIRTNTTKVTVILEMSHCILSKPSILARFCKIYTIMTISNGTRVQYSLSSELVNESRILIMANAHRNGINSINHIM